MGHFDEVCFLCGVTPSGPSEFTDPDDNAESLTDALLKHFPDILPNIPTCKTQKELQAYLEEMFKKILEEFDDFNGLSDAFRDCIAIGYFDDDGGAPREEVVDPEIKCLFPDGRFVTKRWVGEPSCGQFRTVYWNIAPETGEMGELWEEIGQLTRTGSITQRGFGNFFLSECCFGFLEGWIERAALPPMWDERQLSFIGELWEIVNSRKSGRGEWHSFSSQTTGPSYLETRMGRLFGVVETWRSREKA
jgi:hypothetical protein